MRKNLSTSKISYLGCCCREFGYLLWRRTPDWVLRCTFVSDWNHVNQKLARAMHRHAPTPGSLGSTERNARTRSLTLTSLIEDGPSLCSCRSDREIGWRRFWMSPTCGRKDQKDGALGTPGYHRGEREAGRVGFGANSLVPSEDFGQALGLETALRSVSKSPWKNRSECTWKRAQEETDSPRGVKALKLGHTSFGMCECEPSAGS